MYGEMILNYKINHWRISLSDFIGRGEEDVKRILQGLFPKANVIPQVSISTLISPSDYNRLDQEIKNHKFDLVVYVGFNTLVVEVNYKHKEKAAKKWRQIFTNLLVDNGKLPVTIDDYNCEYLFSDSKKLLKKNPWGPTIDVIRELIRQGINPDGSLSKM